MKEVPDELNKIVDKVLAYRPKPKTKAAKKRKRKKTALEKKANPPDWWVFLFGVNHARGNTTPMKRQWGTVTGQRVSVWSQRSG